ARVAPPADHPPHRHRAGGDRHRPLRGARRRSAPDPEPGDSQLAALLRRRAAGLFHQPAAQDGALRELALARRDGLDRGGRHRGPQYLAAGRHLPRMAGLSARGAAALALSVACGPLAAQESGEPAPIADNSFLIEEAYNQEAGVVQHISTFARPDGGGAWAYAFTQEWPFRGMKRQLSYTIPVLSEAGSGTGIGDVA